MTARSDLPYRAGVGVVLFDDRGRVLVGHRIRPTGSEVWQFPQGGVEERETPLEAALLELEEEIGTRRAAVIEQMASSVDYDLPEGMTHPPRWAARYRGQRQHWFAMRFLGSDADLHLDTADPEFDAFRWIPLDEAVAGAPGFKRDAYRAVGEAFRHLARRSR